MNEVLQCMERRYSCRLYDGKMPEKEDLDVIAAAAVQAPSAMNRQPWEVVVINDKALIDRMDEESMRVLAQVPDKSFYNRMMERGGKVFYNAPCMFLVLMQPDRGMDVGIVAENITLAATSLGLGSVICGLAATPFNSPKGEEFKQEIGFPRGMEFGVAVLVGYAAKESTPHEPDMGKIRFMK
ncbi:nitroreductase family protein [Christensenellaceae bacterium OttesenSCG-928-K19]|nr:nitroreductase family protein [Christensenellaceae bacterium OttesenSCG-928-K19]